MPSDRRPAPNLGPPSSYALNFARSTVKPAIQRPSEDQAAQERIKEIWQSGERNRARIAELVSYKQRTVQQYIKDFLDSGELEK